jgi:hypothetical protein
VTIPEPLGKISLPAILSRTELFPADYDPRTTICGSSTEASFDETIENTP